MGRKMSRAAVEKAAAAREAQEQENREAEMKKFEEEKKEVEALLEEMGRKLTEAGFKKTEEVLNEMADRERVKQQYGTAEKKEDKKVESKNMKRTKNGFTNYTDQDGNRHCVHPKTKTTLQYLGAYTPDKTPIRMKIAKDGKTIVEDKVNEQHPTIPHATVWTTKPCTDFQLVFSEGTNKIIIRTNLDLRTSTKIDEHGTVTTRLYSKGYMLMRKVMAHIDRYASIGKAENYTVEKFTDHLKALKGIPGLLLNASCQQDDIWFTETYNGKAQDEALATFKYDIEFPNWREERYDDEPKDEVLEDTDEPKFDC